LTLEAFIIDPLHKKRLKKGLRRASTAGAFRESGAHPLKNPLTRGTVERLKNGGRTMRYSYHFRVYFKNGYSIDAAQAESNMKKALSAIVSDLSRTCEIDSIIYEGRGYLENGVIPFKSKMVRTVRPVCKIVYSR
jgi:hypothetical protein